MLYQCKVLALAGNVMLISLERKRCKFLSIEKTRSAFHWSAVSRFCYRRTLITASIQLYVAIQSARYYVLGCGTHSMIFTASCCCELVFMLLTTKVCTNIRLVLGLLCSYGWKGWTYDNRDYIAHICWPTARYRANAERRIVIYVLHGSSINFDVRYTS